MVCVVVHANTCLYTLRDEAWASDWATFCPSFSPLFPPFLLDFFISRPGWWYVWLSMRTFVSILFPMERGLAIWATFCPSLSRLLPPFLHALFRLYIQAVYSSLFGTNLCDQG